MDLNAPVKQFLEKPTPENYMSLRRFVQSQPDYAPYALDSMDAINKAIAAQDFAGARSLCDTLLRTTSWALSPRAWLTRSFVSKKLEDEKAAMAEGYIASLFDRAILGTGDGSRERPYFVTHVSDEHDVLGFLKKKLSEQALIHEDERSLDHIICVDGSDHWFEITEVLKQLRMSFPSTPPTKPKTRLGKR